MKPGETGSLDPNLPLTEIGKVLNSHIQAGDVAMGASCAQYPPLNDNIMLVVVAGKDVNFGTMLAAIEKQMSNIMGRVVHLQGHVHEEGYVDEEDDGFGPGPETIQ